MDFIDQIKQFSKKAENIKDSLQTHNIHIHNKLLTLYLMN